MLQVCNEYLPMLEKLNLPDNRHIVETKDPEKFYRVLSDTLYIPTLKHVRMHLKTESDKLSESLNGFAADLPQEEIYNWKNLKTKDFSTETDALVLINYLKLQKLIACDIETKDLTYIDNKYLAVGFAWKMDNAASITCFTPKVIKALQELFSLKSITWIWHNGKFDITRSKAIKNMNLDCRIDEDTMLMHYVGINEKRGTHGLKYLGGLYLQAPSWEEELDNYKKVWCRQNKIKLADFTYDMIPASILVPYLHKDVIATFRLYHLFKKIMRPDSEFIYRKLIDASNTFRDVEVHGALADVEYIKTLDGKLERRIERVNRAIAKLAEMHWDPEKYQEDTGAKTSPEKFLITSPKQLKWLLEQFILMPVAGTGKEEMKELLGQYSAILELWNDKMLVGGEHYAKKAMQFLRLVSKVRKLEKMHKTYVVGLQKQIESDGRVRSSYNLHGTETGRLSSSDPNMQNIPRDKTIKNIFVAPKGKVFVQLDYSQAELRVLAVLSDDKWLKQVYYDGKDLHDAVSIEMFGPNFTKEQRVRAKGINFGIAYGRGAASLAGEFRISMSEANKLIDKWFKPMPKVKVFLNDWKNRPLQGKECKTVFNRIRKYIITYDNKTHVQNESVNFPIQSTASDLTLFSLIEISKRIKGLGNIVITVHDSIIIETTTLNAPKVRDIAVEVMRDIPKLFLKTDVPFKADAEIGYKWGALQKFEGGI